MENTEEIRVLIGQRQFFVQFYGILPVLLLYSQIYIFIIKLQTQFNSISHIRILVHT